MNALQTFISAAHTVANNYKNVVRAFRAALQVYERSDLLRQQDREENWKRKVKEYLPKLANGDKAYDRDKRHDTLIAFLFPEVWAVLTADKEHAGGGAPLGPCEAPRGQRQRLRN